MRQAIYNQMSDASDAVLFFESFEISGRHLMGDGEALHELPGLERRSVDDGGAYDAALV